MRTQNIAAAALAMLAGGAHAQVIEWDNSSGGLWNDAANWSPMAVPNTSANTASIAIPGVYDVLLTTSVTVGSLSLTNADASVTIELGDVLTIDAGILNHGEIVVNNTTGGAVTSLVITQPASPMSGTGSLRLNGLSNRSQLLAAEGASIVQGPDHTIHGFGRISAAIHNDGLIDADAAGQAIAVLVAPITNNKTMRASNTGTLDMDNFVLTQGPGGLVVADGGTVQMAGVDVVGGTLDTINAGSFLVNGSSTFDAVTVEGDLTLELGDTITVTNGLVNNAAMTINNTTGGAVTTLAFGDASTLTGDGVLVLNGFDIRSRILANSGTLTHGGLHSIRGFGRIEGAIDNDAPITADVTGQSIFLINATLNNTSFLRATNSGVLDIDSTTINNSSGGTISADGGTVNYGNTTVIGGVIDTIHDGVSLVNISSAFDGVELGGDVTVNLGNTLSISNGLINDGTLTINNSTGGAVTTLLYTDSSSLSGMGTVLLNGFDIRARIITDAGQTVTHEAPHTIRGFGRIQASIINNSLISADVAGQSINIENSDIDNNSVIHAVASGTVDFDGTTVDNNGAVIRADAGTVYFATTTINGGVIESINDGVLFVNGSSTFDGVTIHGPITLGIGQTLTITDGLINNGDLTINNSAGGAVTSLRFDEPASLGGNGSVTLNGINVRAQITGTDTKATLIQGTDHTLRGQGQIAVALTNHGTIEPGFPGVTPIRTMEAVADLTNSSQARYDVEVAGDNNADLIDSTASYHAGGTLTIELIDGFDPAGYWNAPIVRADAGVTGRYDAIIAPPPTDTRLAIRARYLPDEIRIGAVCKPDIDFNGQLNFFDISAFISLFNAQDPDADVAAPFGAWNFFDIATYIAQYNTGCP